MESPNPHGTVVSESHSRHLLARWREIDRLMTEIESVLSAASSGSVFPKYKADLPPLKARVVRDYIANIRGELLRSAEALGVPLPGPAFGSVHSIQIDLTFADIAAEECRPEQLRGYGEVNPELIPQLRGMVEQLKSSLGKLGTFLSEGRDLGDRLQRLNVTGDEIDVLGRISEIIDRRGMVEFRPAIGAIIERLETRCFEIALFGRVSSGKSSLLNYVVGAEVLPVGVTPVTAIPTRVVFGPEPAIEVSFAIGRRERPGIERLPEFVSEQQNKGNEKQIARVVVEFPSPRLHEGIVFVDTPGLGSLATAGAAETLAYLPRCDLGVLLIDSASTLTEEDIGTVRMLLEAGIPASILLSKADLIKPLDRGLATVYTEQKIRERLGLELPVWPVSIAPSDAMLLDAWFEAEIAPLYAKHRDLTRQSIRRKIGALRENVESALLLMRRRGQKDGAPKPETVRHAAVELRAATGAFDQAARHCLQELDLLHDAPARVIAEIAREAASLLRSTGKWEFEGSWVLSATQRIAAEQAHDVARILTDLARDCSRALGECARDLNAPEAPSAGEFLSAIQEMPMIDVGSIDTDLRAGILARTWKRTAARGFEAQLNDRIGPALSHAFSAYSGVLQRWARAALNELRERFDACAELYRARLLRLESTDADVETDSGALENDLARLNLNTTQEEVPTR